MSICIDEKGKMFHKIYNHTDIEMIAAKMHEETGVVDNTVLNMLSMCSPADDINYLGAFIKWDIDNGIYVKWFPRNWNEERIIEFLINKYNKNIYFFSWYEELQPEAKIYGLHYENDFSEPYIKI